MTGQAVSAIAGIQTTLAQLRGEAPPATPGSANVFGALLAQLTSAAPATATADSWGQQIVEDARGFLGTPYVLGGTTKNGIDCSGLVKTILGQYGVDAPHHSGLQGNLGTEVPSLAEAKPGDLIVTNGGRHIVVYAGDNKVIHAPSPGKNVTEQELWTGDAGIVTIRRIDPPESFAPPAATLPVGVDMQSVLAGLSLLGNLAGTLGSGALGTGAAGGMSSPFGASPFLASSSLLGGTPLLGAPATSSSLTPDLASLELQRWVLQQKGTA